MPKTFKCFRWAQKEPHFGKQGSLKMNGHVDVIIVLHVCECYYAIALGVFFLTNTC